MGGLEYCILEVQVAPNMKLYVVDDVTIIDRVCRLDIVERGLTKDEALTLAHGLNKLNNAASK